jgi:hypothetical protein
MSRSFFALRAKKEQTGKMSIMLPKTESRPRQTTAFISHVDGKRA